jgi:hypothetical protein
MENVIKGWFTTSLGIILVIAGLLHVFGIYRMPNPELMDNYWKIGLYFLISFSLALFSKSKIEIWLEDIAKAVFGIFKKKAE